MSKHLLNAKEAAEWLNIGVRTLKKLPIRRVRIGRSVRFDPKDLQAWCDLHGTREKLMKESA